MNLKFKFQNYAPIFEIFQNYTHAAISPRHKGLAATLYICCVIPPGAKGLAAKPYDGQPLNTITNNRMNLCVTDPNKGGSFYEKTFEQKSSRHSMAERADSHRVWRPAPCPIFLFHNCQCFFCTGTLCVTP
jgi:hypothetical protein